jgi:hypothetical protein
MKGKTKCYAKDKNSQISCNVQDYIAIKKAIFMHNTWSVEAHEGKDSKVIQRFVYLPHTARLEL